MTNTSTGKHIEYDRITKDYAARYEGDLIGYAKTYHDASVALDAYVYELLSSPLAQTATALDGGSIDALLTIEAGAALDQTLASLDTQPAPAFTIGQRVSCPAGWGRIDEIIPVGSLTDPVPTIYSVRLPYGGGHYWYAADMLTAVCTDCGDPAVLIDRHCAACYALAERPQPRAQEPSRDAIDYADALLAIAPGRPSYEDIFWGYLNAHRPAGARMQINGRRTDLFLVRMADGSYTAEVQHWGHFGKEGFVDISSYPQTFFAIEEGKRWAFDRAQALWDQPLPDDAPGTDDPDTGPAARS